MENPVVWLLRRIFTLDWIRGVDSKVQAQLREWERAMQAGDRERAQAIAAEIAARLRLSPFPQPFWSAHDRKIVIGLSVIALLALAGYRMGVAPLLTGLQGRTTVLMALLSIANVLPFVYTSLLNLLQREHAQGTAVFLRLTRLSGRDLLIGAFGAYVLAGATRLFIVWGAPILIPLGVIIYGSGETATLTFVRAGLCLTAMGILWQVLLGLMAVRQPNLLWQIVVWVVTITTATTAWLASGPLAGALMQGGFVQALQSAPVWWWVAQPAFWASVLFPPLAVSLCPVVLHPLWGVLHTLIWLAVARALFPLSARRLQRMLNAPEPEPKSQEGAWW